MPSFCSSNFYSTFSQYDMVTYVTGCYRVTPQRKQCIHLLFDATGIALEERICLQNSLWGATILSYQSYMYTLRDSVRSGNGHVQTDLRKCWSQT